MTLSTQSVRYLGSIGGASGWSGLPRRPDSTAVPSVGQLYPSTNIVRRSVRGALSTWMARMGGTSSGENIPNAIYKPSTSSNSLEGYICDPDLVDWGSVTRTGPPPSNVYGGVNFGSDAGEPVPRALNCYSKLIGTATLESAILGTTIASAEAREVRQPILVGNAFVEARKLPAYIPHYAVNSMGYASQYVIGQAFDPAVLIRYINGPASFTAYGQPVAIVFDDDTDPGNTIEVFVAPVDPGNLQADYDAGVSLGVITPPDGILIYDSDLAAAGVVRWEFFYLWFVPTGSVTPGALVTLYLYAPVDIPPPYTCAGVDGIIPGGYYS